MRRGSRNDVWTEQDNQCLLALHAVMGNDWKGISCRLRSRTGNQVKNQFYNIIRVLIRRAFKNCFENDEQVSISAIRPSLLSNLMRMSLSSFSPGDSVMPSCSIRQFLSDMVSHNFNDSCYAVDAQKTMINIKTWLLAQRWTNEFIVFGKRQIDRWQTVEKKGPLDDGLLWQGGRYGLLQIRWSADR